MISRRELLKRTIKVLAGGALLGGWLSDRLGRVRATLVGEGAAAALVLAACGSGTPSDSGDDQTEGELGTICDGHRTDDPALDHQRLT